MTETAMTETLDRFGRLAATPVEGIRWACILEATAPKVGNVFPGRSFDDLDYADFITAAQIASSELTAVERLLPQRMLDAVRKTVEMIGTNVNLGILLLLGPLVEADLSGSSAGWPAAIRNVLRSLDDEGGKQIFSAIATATPGGLGSVESNDVNTTTGPIDIVHAMAQAADRDRIALQYATNFDDLITNVIPIVRDSILASGDILTGVSRAHLRLLAIEPDSLIARKCGSDFALQVRDRAAKINIDDQDQIERFDQWLRADGHRRNPGTTADLIAASLYIILRTAGKSS